MTINEHRELADQIRFWIEYQDRTRRAALSGHAVPRHAQPLTVRNWSSAVLAGGAL